MMELLRRLFPLERGMWWRNMIWGLIYAVIWWFPMPEGVHIPKWVIYALVIAAVLILFWAIFRGKQTSRMAYMGWFGLGMLAGGCMAAAVKLPEGFRIYAEPGVLLAAGGSLLVIHLFLTLLRDLKRE